MECSTLPCYETSIALVYLCNRNWLWDEAGNELCTSPGNKCSTDFKGESSRICHFIKFPWVTDNKFTKPSDFLNKPSSDSFFYWGVSAIKMRLFWLLRDGNSKHSIWRLKRHFRGKPGCGGKPPWLAMISSKKLRDEWGFFSASTCPSFRPLEKISVISLNPRNWELTYLMTGKCVLFLALECFGCVVCCMKRGAKSRAPSIFGANSVDIRDLFSAKGPELFQGLPGWRAWFWSLHIGCIWCFVHLNNNYI